MSHLPASPRTGRNTWVALGLLVGLFLLVLACPPAFAQSRTFYDGAETGTGAFRVNTCTAVALAADGGAPAQGGKMWRCGWNGTLPWTDPNKLRDMTAQIPYGREVLVRFKRRYDANADWTMGSKEWRISFETSGELYGACQREKGPAAADLFLAGNSLSSHWGGGPPCGVGWREIAIYRKDAINGTGGITRVWQDGKLLREWAGNTGGHGEGMYWPSNWSSNPGWEHDALNYIYFDELEGFVDLTTGTAITGRLSDNTAQAVRAGGPPPPPPILGTPCEGNWQDTYSAPTPLVCDATQVQTRLRIRTWTTTKEPTNGGTACPANPPPVEVKEACEYVPPPPPPPPPVPTIVGRFASQVPYTSGGVSGLRVTIRVPAGQALPTIGRAVTLRVPLPSGYEDRAGTVRATKANAYSGGDGQVVLELPGVQAISLQFLLP